MKSHPSKDVLGSKGSELKDRRIVLCITGSVTAVKSPDIARELMRHGAEVDAVIRLWRRKLYTLTFWSGLREILVVTELTEKVEHVALAGDTAKRADLVLVAHATANTISKIASGIDDTPVTSVVSVALGSKIPHNNCTCNV